jgi:hypothetical protein
VQSPPAELSLLRQAPPLTSLASFVVPANKSLQLYYPKASGRDTSSASAPDDFYPIEARVSFVRPAAAARISVFVQSGNGSGGHETFIDYMPPPATAAAVPYNVSCTGTSIDPRSGATTQLWLAPADSLLNMTLYSDNIVIESFLQDGRVAYTIAQNAALGENGVRIGCQTADPAGCKIESAEVWRLDSIWVSEEELLAAPRQDRAH